MEKVPLSAETKIVQHTKENISIEPADLGLTRLGRAGLAQTTN
jgi:hypothetical protein